MQYEAGQNVSAQFYSSGSDPMNQWLSFGSNRRWFWYKDAGPVGNGVAPIQTLIRNKYTGQWITHATTSLVAWNYD